MKIKALVILVVFLLALWQASGGINLTTISGFSVDLTLVFLIILFFAPYFRNFEFFLILILVGLMFDVLSYAGLGPYILAFSVSFGLVLNAKRAFLVSRSFLNMMIFSLIIFALFKLVFFATLVLKGYISFPELAEWFLEDSWFKLSGEALINAVLASFLYKFYQLKLGGNEQNQQKIPG